MKFLLESCGGDLEFDDLFCCWTCLTLKFSVPYYCQKCSHATLLHVSTAYLHLAILVAWKNGDYIDMTDKDTITFTLNVRCERIPGSKEGDPDEKKYRYSKVMSSDLEWTPQGDQEDTYADNPLRPVYGDIPIAKLRPGQEIHLTCFCEKNIGKEHAKWSPVATATYRLMPAISFKKDEKTNQPAVITGSKAQELVDLCPMNVFDIEDGAAIVARPRDCTFCRECIREPEWDEKVSLQKLKQHYIFSVESVGIIPPEVIVEEALKQLINRIAGLSSAFEELKNPRTLPEGVHQLAFEGPEDV